MMGRTNKIVGIMLAFVVFLLPLSSVMADELGDTANAVGFTIFVTIIGLIVFGLPAALPFIILYFVIKWAVSAGMKSAKAKK